MFRRYHAHIDCELAPGREIVIVHDPLPPDVAFLSVGVRRYGPDEAPPRQLLRPHDLATGNRRDLTVLSSGMCGDPP
ncbi:MAG TPA: hypothetical protein VFU21_33520, partial [Kofleriaceae bacterium]|nr:hypothetical protein [Kofleriaceae bacterium]